MKRAIFIRVATKSVASRPFGKLDFVHGESKLYTVMSDVALTGKDCKRNSPLPYRGCG